ncbi:hypothetical protein FRD01_02580 [Microvenator marinus]|uniref:Uncharacterized protein n=1 Tax=Microvenator marinus TaxID=2600177 RepID=A0A5B8XK35_9DELT|nr:hypothetical protein [Microvenator marinus]QED26162.1 hypothetical protein FRD01_02580 [Microvenator marinus]
MSKATKAQERQRDALLREIVAFPGQRERDYGAPPEDIDPIGAFTADVVIFHRGVIAWDDEGRCVRLSLENPSFETEPGSNCLRLCAKDLPGRIGAHTMRGQSDLLMVWLEDGRCYVTDLLLPEMPFHRRHAWDLSLEQAESNLAELEAIRVRKDKAEKDRRLLRAEQLRESARLAELEAKLEAETVLTEQQALEARLKTLETLKVKHEEHD